MARLTFEQMKALNVLFDEFTVDDQRRYYERAVERNRRAAAQINRLRATMSLLTGLGAVVAGWVVQAVFIPGARCTAVPVAAVDQPYCTAMSALTILSAIVAVVAPALGGALSTLADLYQWDRLVSIYDNALDTLAVADAYSPDPEMDEITYRASLNAFSEGTLNVMQDESAQWGQLIRQPESLREFVVAAMERANKVQTGQFKVGNLQPQPPDTSSTPGAGG